MNIFLNVSFLIAWYIFEFSKKISNLLKAFENINLLINLIKYFVILKLLYISWNNTNIYEGRSISKVNFPVDGSTLNFVVYGQKLALFKPAYTKIQPKPTLGLHLAYVWSERVSTECAIYLWPIELLFHFDIYWQIDLLYASNETVVDVNFILYIYIILYYIYIYIYIFILKIITQ